MTRCRGCQSTERVVRDTFVDSKQYPLCRQCIEAIKRGELTAVVVTAARAS